MKLPFKSQYPSTVSIPCKDGGVQVYKIKWVRRFKESDTLAECDPSEHVIRIKLGQKRADIFKCFLHEVLHAIEFEWPMNMRHSGIYRLEEALFELLRINV